jgi:hypothetical protein
VDLFFALAISSPYRLQIRRSDRHIILHARD